MTALHERPLRRRSGRILLLASLLLAAAAAAALVLGADDARLLRLGIVAALWAALLGAFAAARMRRDAHAGAERVEALRETYRLELEREITARREHELTVERELREQVQDDERAEIAALRTELAALRANLQNLMGGDVMVERVALRAESTRLLGLGDQRAGLQDRVLPAAPADAGVVTPPDWSADWSSDWSSLSVSVPPLGGDRLGGDRLGEVAEVGRVTPAYQAAPPPSVLPEPGGWQRGPLDPPTTPPGGLSEEPTVRTGTRASRHAGAADAQWAPAVTPSSWAAAGQGGRHGWHHSPNGHADSNGHATVSNGSGNGNAAVSNGNGSAHTGSPSRPATPMPSQRPGAHSGGLPVVDLLAAHGGDVPRRRRRRDGE